MREWFKAEPGVGRPVPLARPLAPFAALLVALLLAPAATGKWDVAADLEATLAYLEGVVTSGEAGDEPAPYLVEAAVAAGRNPAEWPAQAPVLGLLHENLEERAGRELIHHLRPAYALAVAGGLGPDDELTRFILAQASGGQFGDAAMLNDDIWSILALTKAGVPATDARIQDAASHVAANQDAAGGWSHQIGAPGVSDMTGMALEALVAAGRLNESVSARAVAFLALETYACSNMETPSETCLPGGVALVKPGAANCNSSVWALRGLAAAGEPMPPGVWQFLHRLRRDDGSYRFSEGLDRANIFCTLEVATLLGMGLQKGWDMTGSGPEGEGRGAAGIPAPGLVVAAIAVALSGLVRKSLRTS